MTKTKQEILEEYEKDYLNRLEGKQVEEKEIAETKESPGLQDVIFQVTQQIKEHETKDYIGICSTCKKPITREELKYEKGKSFHTDCYVEHENEIVSPSPEIANKSSNMKAELALLKNLQVIQSANKPTKPKTKSTRKKTVKRKKKSKTRKKVSTKKKKQGSKKKRKSSKKASRALKRKKTVKRKKKSKTRKKVSTKKKKQIRKKKVKRKTPQSRKIKSRKLKKKTKRRTSPKKSARRRR